MARKRQQQQQQQLRVMSPDLAYDGDVEETQRRRRQRLHKHSTSLIPTVYEPFDAAKEQHPAAYESRDDWSTAEGKHRDVSPLDSPALYAHYDQRPERIAHGSRRSAAPARRGESFHGTAHRKAPAPAPAAAQDSHWKPPSSRSATTESLNDWMLAGDRLFAASKSHKRSQARTGSRRAQAM